MTRQHAQFLHIATYPFQASSLRRAQAWSVQDIVAEARRDPKHCPHVPSPRPPLLLAGVPLDDVVDYVAAAFDAYRLPTGRRQRKDKHILSATICSYPVPRAECTENDYDCAVALFRDAIDFHTRHLGDVLSAVMHVDEKFLHCHMLHLDPGMDVRRRIPGWRAKRDAEAAAHADGLPNYKVTLIAQHAFRVAMAEFQDLFHDEVGSRHGLFRKSLSPRKRIPAPIYFLKRKAALEHTQSDAAQDEQKREGPIGNSSTSMTAIGISLPCMRDEADPGEDDTFLNKVSTLQCNQQVPVPHSEARSECPAEIISRKRVLP